MEHAADEPLRPALAVPAPDNSRVGEDRASHDLQGDEDAAAMAQRVSPPAELPVGIGLDRGIVENAAHGTLDPPEDGNGGDDNQHDEQAVAQTRRAGIALADFT